MLCLKDRPSEDYEHFVLLLLFQLIIVCCCLEQIWFVKFLILREPFSPWFSVQYLFKQGRNFSVLPIDACAQDIVTNTLSAVKPLS